jgi:hypothetical protein
MKNPRAVVVDAFNTSFGFTDAFGAVGADVVQVQSTPELLPGVTPVDPSRFSHTLVHDGDIDALTDRVASLRPDAVLPGRESGVELADVLSDRLGLRSNGTKLSPARRDKYLQIERVRAQGVPAARQIRTGDEAELRAWHEDIGGTVVVKPLRGGGGEGVRFCDSPADSAAALTSLLHQVTTLGGQIDSVVAQEYLVGAEYIVNTVSCDGVHHVTDVWSTDRITANGVRDLVVTQVLMRSDDHLLLELVPHACQVLDALGIRHGPAHVEIKLTPDGPRLVEVNARMSGLPYYVADAIGDGQLEWSVDAYLRPERFHERAGAPYTRRSAFAWAALVSPVSGRLVRYRALDEIRRLESFRDMTVVVRPGERIVPTTWDLGYPATLTFSHAEEAIMRRDLNTLRFLDGEAMYEVEPD